jgi:hypothetical protein
VPAPAVECPFFAAFAGLWASGGGEVAPRLDERVADGLGGVLLGGLERVFDELVVGLAEGGLGGVEGVLDAGLAVRVRAIFGIGREEGRDGRQVVDGSQLKVVAVKETTMKDASGWGLRASDPNPTFFDIKFKFRSIVMNITTTFI